MDDKYEHLKIIIESVKYLGSHGMSGANFHRYYKCGKNASTVDKKIEVYKDVIRILRYYHY